MSTVDIEGQVIENTIVFALNDTADDHNVPSMSMGQTKDGANIMAKAVFADQESAELMADFMNEKAGQSNRFQIVMVELWRPTDIELYARRKARELVKENNTPKLILPG